MGFWNDFINLFSGRSAPPTLTDATNRRADNASGSRGGGGSIVNPLTGLGGPHDKGSSAYPNLNRRPLDEDELESLYLFNGIARKIIDYFPKRATRKAWEVPDIGEEDKRLRTRSNLREGLSLARAYGDAVVLMVTEDDVPPGYRNTPSRWLEQPIDLERVGKLHALHALDVWEAHPLDVDRNPRSNNFRLPLHFSVSTEGFQATVHHSRVLFLRGRRKPMSRARYGHHSINRMPDDSELQAIWDEIRRLTSVMQGGAILAEELRHSVLKVGDLATHSTGDQASKFEQRIRLMRRSLSLMGMAVIGPNDEFEVRSSPPSGFGELSESGQAMLSAVSDIPRVDLFGDAPGGLGTDGESHKEDARQAIAAYQDDNLDPLEQLYQVVYAAHDGPTGGQIPDEWGVEFKPLDEPKEHEVAEVRRLMADIDQLYIDMGVYTEQDVAKARFGEDGWQLDMGPIEPPTPEDRAILEGARERLRVLAGGRPLTNEPGGEHGSQAEGAGPVPAPPRA
ncbi:MAG: DUF1073 domain-containing protein [Myxococcota bacterium]